MIFKPKFFLDLGGADQQKPAVVAPVRQEAAAAETTPAAVAQPVALSLPVAGLPVAIEATPAQAGTAEGVPAAITTLTTAEAMVAELAAAQANRPAPSKATFAPDCVTAGGATPMNRRTGGANLAGFKEMAKGMMRS